MKLVRGLALLILLITMIHAARVAADQTSGAGTAQPSRDLLARELERCKALNEKAGEDAGCQAAYAESRRRFFQPPAEYHPPTVEMFPKTKNQPLTTGTPSNPSPEK